jgi:hypothetical protein
LADPKRIDGIEIEQDLDFQRKSWTVQRVSWVIMVVIAVAGLLGLFGGGPLSDATAGNAQTLRVDYQRLVRQSATEKFGITPGSTAMGSGSTVSVWLDREWMSKHELRGMVPEPESTSVAADRVTYHFRIDSLLPSKIELDMETRAIGLIRGRAGIVGGNTVSFNQFSYP